MNAAKITLLRPRTPRTLLVLEDEVLTRFTIADALRASGYRVLEASSAEDAIAILENLPVHLLLIDIHMPAGQSGLAVADAAQRCLPPPKIVFTSGKVDLKQVPDLESIGPFIPKPYLVSHVVDVVHRSLNPIEARL